MNWQKEAVNDLKSYEARRQSVDNLKERIADLEKRAIKLGGTSNSVPVQGGGNRNEEALVNNIAERERLTMALSAAQKLVDVIDRGLAVLDDDEYKVLEGFYINRSSRHLDKLCDDLHCEKSTVYRIKDQALYKFTVAMYGIIDF